ncbi:DNase I-like protein [Ramaria rubella]|nr:DNase I-like protein [Ramaria rubella]
MRIVSWNVNGIRTLSQYHPWNTLKTGDAILDELNGDIICLQETKIQRTALQKHFAAPDRYDSFFSFPVTKGGYSGVAVYTKTETVAPLKAEEGLTGVLQPKPSFSLAERISPAYPQAHQIDYFRDENDESETPPSLTALDAEGRALVIDFGLFVLINVYCPAETSETRLPFKMNFHLLLEERVRKLMHEEGREVIVIGDINITATPIDHCDGQLPSLEANFWTHPPRAWFKNWLGPSGPMVDVVRDVWPERKGMYTCWNTKIAARDSNYGTRIDYILLTQGLLPWFKHGDIQPSIRGSDHCPVYIDLHDEIQLDSGQKIKLRDAMRFDDAKQCSPRISARFWDEFKQRLLSNFFTPKVPGASLSTSCSSSAQDAVGSESSSQTTATDIPSSQSETPGKLQNSPAPMAMSSSSLKRTSSISSSKGDKDLGNDSLGNSKKKKRKVGQTKISSFFTKHAEASSSVRGVSRTSSPSTIIDADEGDVEMMRREEERSQMEADRKLALSLSEPSDTAVTRAPRTVASSSLQSKAVWGHLLAPLQPPKCKAHGEPCKEYTVNKPGPNKGKTFFLCSRPVGPGYDRGRTERLREEVDLQYRCDFFKWASEVKKAALQDRGKGVPQETIRSESKPMDATTLHIPP